MQVEVAPVDDATTRLTITLSTEDVDRAIESTYRRLAQRVKIPGFRPGKAPRAMLLRTYGEDDFYHRATDEAIREWYPRALRESGIEALDSGHLEDGDEDAHLSPGSSFSFTALVPTVPEIKLPEYGEIKIPAPITLVTDEDVAKVIEEVRLSRATLEPAPGRAAGIGDVVKMNLQGRAGGDEVINRTDYDFELVDEEKSGPEARLPGLSKQLVDAKPGDIREINLPLPSDYSEAEMAGKTLILNIVVKEVQRKVLPELTDEFAQQVSSAKTVQALREMIRHNLEHEKNEDAITKVAAEVVDSLIARANPTAPEPLVVEEQDRLMRRQREYLERAGLPFDRFLIAAKKTEEEYRDELRPSAERSVKRDLILDAVAKAENIEPPAEEVEAEVRQMSAAISRSERDYDRLSESSRLHEAVTSDLRRRTALNTLVQMASGLSPLKHDHDATEAEESAPQEDKELQPSEEAAVVAGTSSSG